MDSSTETRLILIEGKSSISGIDCISSLAAMSSIFFKLDRHSTERAYSLKKILAFLIVESFGPIITKLCSDSESICGFCGREGPIITKLCSDSDGLSNFGLDSWNDERFRTFSILDRHSTEFDICN
ncbi:hypothetical protein DERP_013255 [Dermatophagoides pteronyssinus]|uniref:Uncharacterized protein n=1 Tax=Dermatophagoides pteronyssinus TaxID=6956 RepID=A0ABQ8IRL1_DERPT|nr:hypothetical protein DERP_013255 [Dermatophagoides pteronyssinus]